MPYPEVAVLLVTALIVGFFIGYWRWGRDVNTTPNLTLSIPRTNAPWMESNKVVPPEEVIVATLREAREAASHDSTEPLYSHRAWRSMLRAALYYVDRYNDMIYQVGKIYPGETRFQTAMRYLRQAEEPTNNIGCAATPVSHLANAISDNAEMT